MKAPRLFPLILGIALSVPSFAQTNSESVLQQMDIDRASYEKLAMNIWDYAELGYQETRSSAAIQKLLENAGFTIESGVAGIPTAFVATYSKGGPIVGILGEFDALPGLSQTAEPVRNERPGSSAGHGCGHHLFGAGSAAAAVAVKNWLETSGQPGTIRYYGCPAEEGGAGKVYMIRAGLFKGVDTVFHWHPADRNMVINDHTLANKSAKFRFHGISSHAAVAPERGRSALKGVESFNFMMNMMREHVPESSRIHYVITNGGEAPNVVPDFAEVFYYVRSPDRKIAQDIWQRMEKAAQGAALGTGTTVDHEVVHGVYELLSNDTLAALMHAQLTSIGGITYDEKEKDFAARISTTFPNGKPTSISDASKILPLSERRRGVGSTDVGDVSWNVPTMGIRVATWVPGTPAHSWQATACGGTSIGLKGMHVAAKTMALSTIHLFTHPEIIKKARAEFEQRRGADFHYEPLLGDRVPPLDYRKKTH